MPFGLCSVIAEKLALLSCRVSSAMIRLALSQCTALWFRCFCSVTDCFFTAQFTLTFAQPNFLLFNRPSPSAARRRPRQSMRRTFHNQNTSSVGFINNEKETIAVCLVNKQRANTGTVAAAHLSCYQFPSSPEKNSLYTSSMPSLPDLLNTLTQVFF